MTESERIFTGRVLWPDPTSGPWAVTVEWRIQYGVPTPVGLHLRSYRADDLRGVAERLPAATDDVALARLEGRVLRALPFTALLDETLAQVRDEGVMRSAMMRAFRDASAETNEPAEGSSPHLDALESAWAQQAAIDGAPKGRGHGDAHYRRVAEVYKRARASGRNPTSTVAEVFRVEKAGAAKLVSRARARGFLPPTTRGKPSDVQEDL